MIVNCINSTGINNLYYIEGVTLNMPAGLWGKSQYTGEEVAESRRISRARSHVERSIGRIKDYRILSNRVSVKLLPYLTKIFLVCSMLTTVQPVIINDLSRTVSALR